jgi:phosphatidylserine decarboxylase
MKVAKEGLPFVVPFFFLAILSFVAGRWLFFTISLILTFSFFFFFRDPKRQIPQDKNLILAPADGKVIKIENVESLPSFPFPATVVSIFLSLLDVHITRTPLSGTVGEIEDKPGLFFPAYTDDASKKNKSTSVLINGSGTNILINQIAGFAARRIKCFIKKNEKITRGQKIGLIYFGSRVDIYLPREVRLKVSLNQKVKAGETSIAEIKP